MVVATMNFGNQEIVMVAVYSLITLLVMISLALELRKRAEGETDAATASV
jgi:hypothetical protein